MIRAGTIGGTLTIFIANITSGDMIRTALFSAIGAIVSYLVSLGMKKLLKR